MNKPGSEVSSPKRLSSFTRRVLLELAKCAMPPGERFPPPGPYTIERLEQFLQTQPAIVSSGVSSLTRIFQNAARARYGRGFTGLSSEKQLAYLHSLHEGKYAERMMLRFLLTPLKVAQFDDASIFSAIGCSYRAEPVQEERPRYLQRAIDAAELTDGETIEAEVIIVGSGAGGAALAAELAEQGIAVAMVEEGGYYRRGDFTGRPLDMFNLLYREAGATVTVGNCWIPIPMGRCVGGTTTINSGTCYRAPPWILEHWRRDLGLDDFTSETMDPLYAKVEKILEVTPADPRYVGEIGAVIARGCEGLGYRRHGPLVRNAPDCDGKSLCIFGCPTDAKRSANVSYVPLALRQGAHLFYNATAQEILLEEGRAVGIRTTTEAGRTVTFRGGAVVIAAGTLMSPTLLLRNKLANSSGQVGRNLSIHPALSALGLFPEDQIKGGSCIPQGYGMEEFHEEGLLFEGAYLPLDVGAGAMTFFGPTFTRVVEAYEHLGVFGFLIEDTSRGRIRLAPGGHPVMSYIMNDNDVALLKRGMEILFRIFICAGAEAIYPMVPGFTEIRDLRDVERFRNTNFRARDFELTAHHPLGTVRMGIDPRTSVVGPTHEVHDVPGLFVCDGSTVPSSLGVNPQMTIMAMATRAARFVAEAVG